MQPASYDIIDWDEAYEEQAMNLERSNIQGRNIRLEIIKQHSLDRARVFDKHYSCLAISGDTIVGSAAAAVTNLSINGFTMPAGIGFDMKVHPDWRNQGIGKKLTQKLYGEFFSKYGLCGNIMTAKKVNVPVHRMVSNTVDNTSVYSFVYLVLPSHIKINTRIISTSEQRFQTRLTGDESLAPSFFTRFESGLGCFYTHRMYALKVNHIDWKLKSLLKVLRIINPGKYASLPSDNEIIFPATLFDYSVNNLAYINEVLRHLQSKGISQLMVCCQENDAVFRSLKKYSISSYAYTIRADFRINQDDHIGIDVRCL